MQLFEKFLFAFKLRYEVRQKTFLKKGYTLSLKYFVLMAEIMFRAKEIRAITAPISTVTFYSHFVFPAASQFHSFPILKTRIILCSVSGEEKAEKFFRSIVFAFLDFMYFSNIKTFYSRCCRLAFIFPSWISSFLFLKSSHGFILFSFSVVCRDQELPRFGRDGDKEMMMIILCVCYLTYWTASRANKIYFIETLFVRGAATINPIFPSWTLTIFNFFPWH